MTTKLLWKAQLLSWLLDGFTRLGSTSVETKQGVEIIDHWWMVCIDALEKKVVFPREAAQRYRHESQRQSSCLTSIIVIWKCLFWWPLLIEWWLCCSNRKCLGSWRHVTHYFLSSFLVIVACFGLFCRYTVQNCSSWASNALLCIIQVIKMISLWLLLLLSGYML